MSSEKQSESVPELEAPLLTGVLETQSDLVAIVDREIRIIGFNQLYAKASEELLQCPICLGIQLVEALAHSPEHQEQARRVWTKALSGESFTEAITIAEPDTAICRCWEVSFYPLRSTGGRVTGAVHIAREITSRLLHEDQTAFALEWERIHRFQAEASRNQLGSENQALASSIEDLEYSLHLLSHDLREPLRTVLSYVELIKRQHGSQLPDSAHAYLDFVLSGAERLRALIESFLHGARGGVREMAPVSLNQCLEEAVSGLRAQFEATGAEIDVEPLPVVFGIHIELTQVLQNLVSNALTYHKRGLHPQILVRCQQTADFWCISIQDNGIGFAMSEAEQIWRMHERLHPAHPGRGVGLALVKRIVEKHGGNVSVSSIANEGSTFSFTLPLMIYQEQDAEGV